PTPDYTPSIYKVVLDRAAGTFAVVDTIALKTKSGRPISGLPNPQTKATAETAIDLAGNVLPLSPDGMDVEAVVRFADGTFWVSEEMGPSIAEVTADGRIVKRLVPADAAQDYQRADTNIAAVLPTLLSRRHSNRGIEGLALAPDERFLYFIMQSSLDNP